MTSGTIFASHKLPITVYLLAIVLFVNQSTGMSAIPLSLDLSISRKAAFVLAHKIRDAIGAEVQALKLSGKVEVDGCYVGGYVKPANRKEKRIDRRITENRSGRRQVVVVMSQRNGPCVLTVAKSEAKAVPEIIRRVQPGSTIFADEATSWNRLGKHFSMRRINHQEAYSANGVSTNLAESFNSRLCRAEVGIYHHIAGLGCCRFRGHRVRCFMEPEVSHGSTEICTRVQA